MAEDWSLVRSPSRALRRLALGHRQNIREVEEPITDSDVAAARARLLREDVEEIQRVRMP